MNAMEFKSMIASVFLAFLLVLCNGPTKTAAENCMSAKTCRECFDRFRPSHCVWAGEWQECLSRDGGYNSSRTVTREMDCPVMAAMYEGRGVYRVYVDNDLFGLLRHMNRVGMTCSRSGRTTDYEASVTLTGGNSGEVVCSGPEAGSLDGGGSYSFTFGRRLNQSVAFHVKELSLVSFDPERAWWNAGTVLLTVTVRNAYEVNSYFTMVAVTVADRPCNIVYHYLEPGQDPDRKWCEVSFKGPWAGAPGPVIVRFGAGGRASRNVSFELRSTRDFHVLAPQLRAVDGPSCGPKSGGTLLTVLGTGLNAPSRELKMNLMMHGGATGDRSECELVKRDEGRMMCRTIKWDSATAPAQLGVLWDDGMELRAPDFWFSYVDDPAPNVGQRLASIASGGTKVKVTWNSLACVDLKTLRLYLRLPSDGGRRYYTQCRVAADSGASIECTAPAVTLPNDGMAVTRFDCGFEFEFAGRRVDYSCDRYDIEYRVHKDPQFTRFEHTQSGYLIVIHGSGLRNAGFGVEDVTVLRECNEKAHDGCNIKFIADDHIECKPNNARLITNLDHCWKTVIVNVGNARPVVVQHS